MSELLKDLKTIKNINLELKTLIDLRDKTKEQIGSNRELKNTVAVMIENSIKRKVNILKELDKLQSPIMKVILLKRYFHGLGWKTISIDLHKSDTWVRLMHDKAIKQISENMTERIYLNGQHENIQ